MSESTPIHPNGTPVPLKRGDRVVVVRGKRKRELGTVDSVVIQGDEGIQVLDVALDGGDTVPFGRRSLVKYDDAVPGSVMSGGLGTAAEGPAASGLPGDSSGGPDS